MLVQFFAYVVFLALIVPNDVWRLELKVLRNDYIKSVTGPNCERRRDGQVFL